MAPKASVQVPAVQVHKLVWRSDQVLDRKAASRVDLLQVPMDSHSCLLNLGGGFSATVNG